MVVAQKGFMGMAGNFKMGGFVPVGDPDRVVTQAMIDESEALIGPWVTRFMTEVAPDARVALLGSLVCSFCLSMDEPSDCLAFLFHEWETTLPRLVEQMLAARQ